MIGRDINLDILRVDGYKKFCNKIWNATRFALLKLDQGFTPSSSIKLTGKESAADLWILHKLYKAAADTNQYLEQMNFMQATSSVYQFWWTELCDVYLEVCKPVIDGNDKIAKAVSQNVLYTCLEQGLKLLHPFMPFVTEELYQRLPRRPNDIAPSIMIAEYPEAVQEWQNEKAGREFEFINSVVHASRSLIGEYNVKGARIMIQTPQYTELLQNQTHIVKSLIKGCDSVEILEPHANQPIGCTLYTLEETKIFLLVKGFVNFEQEIEKLKSKSAKIQKLHDAISAKQSVDSYSVNVKDEIKVLDENKLNGYRTELEAINSTIENFSKLLLE
jgi:valyl-tRNA synthetase